MEEVSGLSKRFARKLPRPMVEKQLPTLNNRERKKSPFLGFFAGARTRGILQRPLTDTATNTAALRSDPWHRGCLGATAEPVTPPKGVKWITTLGRAAHVY